VSSPAQRTQEGTARSGRLRAAAARLGAWRDLRLPVKLGLVTLVPMVVMLTLGVVLVHNQLANAGQYARASRITQLSASVRTAISALQDEREQVATGPIATAAPTGSSTARDNARHEVDTALDATRRAVRADSAAGDLDPVATAAWSAADRQLAQLPSLRGKSAATTPDRSRQVGGYTQLVDSLFAFDRVLMTGLADADLTREALSLYDLFAAREEVRYQQSVVLVGITGRTMSVDDVTSLHGSEARSASRINDFRAVASEDVAREYDRAVGGPTLARQRTLLGRAIDRSGGMTGQVMPGMVIAIPVGTWNTANRTVTWGLDTVVDNLAATLRTGSTALRSGANDAAGTAIAVLLVALVATVALVVLIARQLLNSIGVLRRTARDVASRQLPDAVERIRAGEAVDATVAPVGVHTSDEVGQLARAFDAVHGEALRLAVAQANLRANYSELFVNLSRRSQSLVQRQLRLIEQLERDEEDPDQLSALFKLDHLATRMRRNNENLMVLSGNELTRGTGQPVSMADLLRAAVSEIEHYQRVVVQPPPDAHVVGYAAGDLVRLLAELLDNATAFSAPDTPVTVASHRTRRQAIVIDIVDHGIGMGDEELARANEQLGHPAGVEGRISRRMGLFVISRLANQHDVRVRLHGGQDIPGLRVTITVPVELVIGEPEPLAPPHRHTGGGPMNPGGPNGSGPLPKRTAGANRPNGAWSGALHGTLDSTTTGNGAAVGGIGTGERNGAALAQGASVADPVAAAMTVTIPQLPSAISSGVGLFAPLSDEDCAAERQEPGAADGAGADAGTEITPIYDTMASAWFEETRPGTAARPADEPAPETATDGTPGWRFAADEGWQAVGAVVDVQPAEFTASGLPKREPKARLLPGSVQETGAPPAERQTGVPAERLRDRLAGFQQGLQRGRRQTGAAEPAEPLDWSAQRPAVRVEPAGLRPPADPPALPDLPRRTPVAVTEVPSAEGWTSAADDGWRAVSEVADTAPGAPTRAGLPRRQPRAHLLPGSVGAVPGSVTVPPNDVSGRDAGAMRDRLSSFQRGVREGRGGQETVAAADRVEHGFHW
jgi:signal transduction histidine kinase